MVWLTELLQRELKLQIDMQKLSSEITSAICLQSCYMRYFERILKKVKPKVIIEQCYYGFDKMFLNQAAKKCNIPTIELQHGTMGTEHVAYNFLCRNMSFLPDYIFLYSGFWKDETRLPYDNEHIRVTGSANLELMKKKASVSKIRTGILFIGQMDMSLFEMALELSRLLKKKGIVDKRVLYKLHPNFDNCYEECCERAKVYSDILEIVSNADKNLYDCFTECYAQIGTTSTGLFEGLAFNLKTYIVDNQYVDVLFQTLIEKEYVKVIHSVEEILDDDDCIEKDIDYLWKENALSNTIKEINRIKEGC